MMIQLIVRNKYIFTTYYVTLDTDDWVTGTPAIEWYVQNGFIDADQYKAITGDDYVAPTTQAPTTQATTTSTTNQQSLSQLVSAFYLP